MSLNTDVNTKLNKISKEIEMINTQMIIDDLIHYLNHGDITLELDEERLEELKEIKKVYDVGLKFSKNHDHHKRKGFLSNKPEQCLKELEMIKFLYSRATYFRYKKMFKLKFPEHNLF